MTEESSHLIIGEEIFLPFILISSLSALRYPSHAATAACLAEAKTLLKAYFCRK